MLTFRRFRHDASRVPKFIASSGVEVSHAGKVRGDPGEGGGHGCCLVMERVMGAARNFAVDEICLGVACDAIILLVLPDVVRCLRMGLFHS